MSENRQLDADLVQFVAEQVRNVASPMILTELCREFKKKNGTSENKLLDRLRRIRDKMSELENFDIDTKVKMIFALGAPVSNGLLIELKKEADVALDEQHRIIKYKKNGNDFRLSGVHIRRSFDTKREKRMMKFLAEKSENATSPMADITFANEFNPSDKNLKNDDSFNRRYALLKKQIYLTPEYDQETKIKMLFVSNTKVHKSILDELRKTAVVEVDEYQRITKYKANNGNLKLEGKRRKHHTLLEPTTKWSKKEREQLLNFIVEKSKHTKVPLTVKHLNREFANRNGVSRTASAVEHYVRTLLPNISKLNDFDIETRMRMLFTLSVPVEEGFLNKLRKNAVVEVDKYKRITKYETKNGSLQLKTKRSPPNTVWSEEENVELLNFIVEKSKQTTVPLNTNFLIREFAEKNHSRTIGSVRTHISTHLSPNLAKLDSVDMETKVRMIFALSVSVDEQFLNELRKKASVKIDEQRRITKYTAKDGSLELKGDHSMSAKVKAGLARKKSKRGVSESSVNEEETEDDDEKKEESFDEEDEDIINTNTAGSGKLSKRQCSDDDNSSNSDDSDDSDSSESGNDSQTEEKTDRVTKRDNFRPGTKKGRKGRKIQVAETDDESENEESEEEDDHSCESSEKVNNSKSRKAKKVTRKSRISYFSETSDDESEEEYQENEESEASSSTRKSERISKKRYSDNDFSCDFYQNFDNVSLGSPENSDDSNKEKETENLVDVASNSSPKIQRVENQKRKTVENSSDTTSSSLKSRKRGRETDTPNHTETDKIVSGMNLNDDKEAVHDSPGKQPRPIEKPIKQESVSNKKVKLENEEIKPDLSFLSNTNQNNMPNFSVVNGIHTDDVEHSTDNTEESTSGKEFLKSLGGLVHTLDSPILAELQSKIEKAIKEIGDGDHKIPTDEIARTLHTGLYILNKNATRKPPRGESTSLRDFFLILQSTLSTFRCSSLMSFELKLKKNIKELNGQDKVILVDSIERVLGAVFLLVSP